MADPINPLLLKILDACKAQSPEPLYPKPFAIAENLDRKHLDDAFDHLRVHGLIKFTDWVAGNGQGYALTDEGARILQNPMLLSQPLPKPEPHESVAGPTHAESTWQRGEAIRNSLLNPVQPVVTRTLLFANLAIFALGWYLASKLGIGGDYLSGSSGDEKYGKLLVEMGSCYPPGILAGEWWRLLSYAFLHRGALHLILNMYFLYNVGPMVESLYGSWRYALLYAISALTGGIVVYHDNSAAVGASGALCGLLMAMAVWIFMSRMHFPREFVSRWQGNIMTNIILIVFISLMPGVSWQGHLGGAIGGGIVAIGLHLNRFGVGWRRLAGMVVVVLVPVAALASLPYSYDERRETLAFFIRFQDRHQDLDEEFNDFYKEYGKKILNEGPKSLGDDQGTVQAKLTSLVSDLKSMSARIDALNSRSDILKGFVPVVRTYLDAQIALGESFQHALSEPAKWNVDRYNEIQKQVHAYQVLRIPLVVDNYGWLNRPPPP